MYFYKVNNLIASRYSKRYSDIKYIPCASFELTNTNDESIINLYYDLEAINFLNNIIKFNTHYIVYLNLNKGYLSIRTILR